MPYPDPAVGDILRDKNDSYDYVIEALASATLVGATVLTLTRLLDGHVRQYMSTAEGFDQDMLVVWQNRDGQSPDDIIKSRKRLYEKLARSNRDLHNRILNTSEPANKILLDILQLAEDTNAQGIDKRLIEIVDSFLWGGYHPSPEMIRRALVNLAEGTNYTPEFINDLQDRFTRLFNTRKDHTPFVPPQARARLVQGAGLEAVGQAEFNSAFRSVTILSDLGMARLDETKVLTTTKLEDWFQRTILGPNFPHLSDRWQKEPVFQRAFSRLDAPHLVEPETRMLELIRSTLADRNGQVDGVTENIIRKRVKQALRDPASSHRLIGGLLDTIPGLKEASIRLAIPMKDIDGPLDMEFARVSLWSKENPRAYRTRHPFRTQSPRLDYEYIANMSAPAGRHYNIDMQTFLRDIVANNRIRYNGLEGSILENPVLRNDVQQAFQINFGEEARSLVYVSHDDLKALTSMRAGGDPVDLHMIATRSKMFATQIGADKIDETIRAQTANAMPYHIGAASMPAVAIDIQGSDILVSGTDPLLLEAQKRGFEIGYNDVKVAFAQLRGESTVLVSEVGTPISKQIALAREFLTKGGNYILDIEMTPEGTIEEIGLGRTRSGTKMQFDILQSVRNVKTPAQERAAILELVRNLQEHGDGIIGTQTNFDISTIVDRIDALVLSGTEGVSELLVARQTLAQLAGKGLGLELIPQLAGEKGSIKQSELMLKYGLGIQTHEGENDIKDSARLWFETPLGGQALNNIDELELLAKSPKTLYFGERHFPNFAGRFLRLSSVQPSVGGKTNPHVVTWDMMHYKDGHLMPTGLSFDQAFDSVYSLRATLNNLTTVTTDNVTELLARQADLAGDLFERTARSLNPANKQIWDPVGGYVRDRLEQQFGPYGFFRAKAIEIARDAHAQIMQSGFQLDPNAKPSDNIFKAYSQAAASLTVDSFDQVRGGQAMRERALYELTYSLLDPVYKDAVLDQFGGLLKKPFGRLLTDLYDNPGFDWRGMGDNFVQETWSPLAYMIGQGRAAQKEMPGLYRTVEYGPRLGFSAGGVVSALDDKLAKQPSELYKTLNTFASKITLHAGFNQEMFGLLAPTVEKLGVDPEHALSLIAGLISEKNPDQNLYQYKETIEEIGGEFGLFKGKFKALGQIRAEFMKSDEFAKLLSDAIVLKMDRFEDTSREYGVGKRILGEILTTMNLPEGKKDYVGMMQTVFNDLKNEDSGLLESFLIDRFESVDYKTLFDTIDDTEVREIKREMTYIHDRIIEQTGEQHNIQVALYRSYLARSKARSEGTSGRLLDQVAIESLRGSAQEWTPTTPQEAFAAGLWYQEQALQSSENQAAQRQHQDVQQVMNHITGGQSPDIQMQHTAVSRAGRVQMTTGDFANRFGSTLLIAAAAAALLSMDRPDEEFSQGEISDAAQTNIGRYAEIPGSDKNQNVWLGDESPFRLNIRFQGMINSREQQDALVRSVYNSLSGHMEFTKVNSDIQDRRRKNTLLAARDAINF